MSKKWYHMYWLEILFAFHKQTHCDCFIVVNEVYDWWLCWICYPCYVLHHEYIWVYSQPFICYGICVSLEYRQSGRGVIVWARGYGWDLFSYLPFGSLVESLWYVALEIDCSIFHCYMSYSFWCCWITLLFICCWDVICQTLLFLLLNSRDYILLIFFYIWWNVHDTLNVELKLNYFTKYWFGELGCYSKGMA